MLYSLIDLQRSLWSPVADAAGALAEALAEQPWPASRWLRANAGLLHRMTKSYPKRGFGIATVQATAAGGRDVQVDEEVVAEHPFCRLVRFRRRAGDPAVDAAIEREPRVLVCAPLSGHHATLVRDTVATLLLDHDVYVTDWRDARDVPVEHGRFTLAGYVAWVRTCLRTLDARRLHVLSVCQPAVPVLAAVALCAAANEPTPRSLVLMGGPVDARANPTAVDRFATERSLAWFEAAMIHRVPAGYAGHGRAVYPGFLQLAAFVMMNPDRHARAYADYWLDAFRGDAAATRTSAQFYDEYNAVLDLDAGYYLDTVRAVFQDFALANGTFEVDGVRVDPAAITATALFTIEGELDDITGLGQTEAAHALCPRIPAAHKRHLVAAGVGHYGLFSGRRWRDAIYPDVRAFVRTHEETPR